MATYSGICAGWIVGRYVVLLCIGVYCTSLCYKSLFYSTVCIILRNHASLILCVDMSMMLCHLVVSYTCTYLLKCSLDIGMRIP